MSDDTAADIELQPESRLLSLPAELRNRIYEYALADGAVIRVFLRNLRRSERDSAAKYPALLQTCRQTREESSAIWFQQATFRLFDRSTLAALITSLGDRSTLLRNVIYPFRYSGKTEDAARESAAEALRSMRRRLVDLGLDGRLARDALATLYIWHPFNPLSRHKKLLKG